MTPVKYVVALALLGHGVGHAMGFLAAWTGLPMGFLDRPWVFGGNVTIQTAVGRLFGLVWLLSLIGFIGAGLGLLLLQGWWSALAVASSALSIVAIVPWWNTIAPNARLWPLLVNVVVLVALLGPWRDQIAGAFGERGGCKRNGWPGQAVEPVDARGKLFFQEAHRDLCLYGKDLEG